MPDCSRGRQSTVRTSMLVVFLSFVLCGCAFDLPQHPVQVPEAGIGRQDTLVIAIADATASLDPAHAFENASSIILKATYDTLVTFPFDSVDEIKPSLAESWGISEDGLVYTFTLTDAAYFANGDPVAADDVVFSFNRLKHLRGNPSFLMDTVASVEALDDRTVMMTLAQPDPAILAKLVFGAFSVVNKETATAHGAKGGEDVAGADTAEAWLNQNSAGSGPYLLERWEPGVEIVLVRNENYWGEPAAIEHIVFRNIPEAATQKIQIEAGDIDIALDLTAYQVPSLLDNPDVRVHEALSDMLVYIKGNQDPAVGGPVSDPLVLAAVRHALDYEGLRALAGDQAATPASMLPIGFLGAYEANSGHTRDIERAKVLLAEAGYREGLDLELTYPDLTYAGVNFGTYAQKIQADLGEVGINVTLAPGEVGTALEAYRQGLEPFGLWIRLADYRDSVNYVEFLPEGVIGQRLNWTDQNADTEILALRDALRVETDDDVRSAMFEEMQDYLMARGPYAPILQPTVQIGLRNGLEGFIYHPQWIVDLAMIRK